MTPPRFAIITAIAFALVATTPPTLHAAPEEHLAPAPQATGSEAEIITLLEVGTPERVSNRELRLPLYNPTKYTLKGCVVRLQVDSLKINRIYYSEQTAIEPNTDGEFPFKLDLNRLESSPIKVEILKLTYDLPKK